ncbi:AAA family ATPase [Salinicola corii]|uniref:AAA family ATPase n=1 Tax=Salinicola corii TaxID=2606937 RepID=A0A640W7G2_9GAMM|nr:AAA family ATPase [Salinicola corii]
MFDNFLTGYGRGAQKFFDDLRNYETPDDETLDDLDSLAKRLADISGEETTKGPHHVALSAFLAIEKGSVWQERVEVSGESRLAPLVGKLGNGDWLSKGRVFVHDDQCPFCQQGLPHDFLDELTKLLDGDRQQKNRPHRCTHHRLQICHPDLGSVSRQSAGRPPLPRD